MGEKEIISQSHAARIRNVSRQRIHELISLGRFTTPIDEQGRRLHGTLYLSEVLDFEHQKRGRPVSCESNNLFNEGDTVLWSLTPRGGYGYTIPIIASVIKVSNKKIQLHFIGGDMSEEFAWVNPDDCIIYTTSLSDATTLEVL